MVCSPGSLQEGHCLETPADSIAAQFSGGLPAGRKGDEGGWIEAISRRKKEIRYRATNVKRYLQVATASSVAKLKETLNCPPTARRLRAG